MAEKEQPIEAFRAKLVSNIHAESDKINKGARYSNWAHRLQFICDAKLLGISTDEVVAPALKQVYIDSAITPPHEGNNIDIGLLEFVDGMKELGVEDREIAGRIAETLEYRVVEGMGFDGCVECVAIPFAKSEPAKPLIKAKLYQMQKEPTSIRSNPDSLQRSSWEHGTANGIQELYRDHAPALYKAARIYDKIDTEFDYRKVFSWKNEATVDLGRGSYEIHPERLSENGEEGEYRRLLIEQQRLLKAIPDLPGKNRAIELAWLDIVLDSENTAGAVGKNAQYIATFYERMVETAKEIGSPEEEITRIKTTAKDRYNLNM